jgi:hypothetical protein
LLFKRNPAQDFTPVAIRVKKKKQPRKYKRRPLLSTKSSTRAAECHDARGFFDRAVTKFRKYLRKLSALPLIFISSTLFLSLKKSAVLYTKINEEKKRKGRIHFGTLERNEESRKERRIF